MGQYRAKSTDSRSFALLSNGVLLGSLQYPKWYSFKAEAVLADDSKFDLEPRGFWDSKIELKQGEKVLLDFKMGWKGIVIHTQFDGKENSYLLRMKGLLDSKYVLVDTDETELLAVKTDFKWSKLSFDYAIETSEAFDTHPQQTLFLLTIIHCINYYLTMVTAAA